ncbi:hypothetical protein LFM09_46370 [Lentzea alba]|uniref:hypothetical protein n=1 Tax=Lentzea alba TaxID=2714351 RepID=UPI0039BED1F9
MSVRKLSNMALTSVGVSSAEYMVRTCGRPPASSYRVSGSGSPASTAAGWSSADMIIRLFRTCSSSMSAAGVE